MKQFRENIIIWLFEISQKAYCKFKKKTPWNISNQELLKYPKHSFGYQLGRLLEANGFELLPKVERHDAYHLITGYGTTVQEEIALQYCCFGNGKRTPYLLAVLVLGTILLPKYISFYMKSYHYGKRANSFHHFDFKTLLHVDFEKFRTIIFTASNPFPIQPKTV